MCLRHPYCGFDISMALCGWLDLGGRMTLAIALVLTALIILYIYRRPPL